MGKVVSEKSKKNSKFTRVLLNVPTDLNIKYKELSEQQGIPKSYLFVTALNYYLDYKDVMKTMPQILEVYNKALESGETE